MYKPKQIVQVQVINIVPYGVFCQIANSDVVGLIHISEISDFYVKKIEDYIKIGDTFDVQIIEFSEDKNQAKLSYKSIRPDLLKDKSKFKENQIKIQKVDSKANQTEENIQKETEKKDNSTNVEKNDDQQIKTKEN